MIEWKDSYRAILFRLKARYLNFFKASTRQKILMLVPVFFQSALPAILIAFGLFLNKFIGDSKFKFEFIFLAKFYIFTALPSLIALNITMFYRWRYNLNEARFIVHHKKTVLKQIQLSEIDYFYPYFLKVFGANTTLIAFASKEFLIFNFVVPDNEVAANVIKFLKRAGSVEIKSDQELELKSSLKRKI